jgi:glycosyltransferase involved in cell wall biosynthesis
MDNNNIQKLVVTVIIPALNEEISIGSMVIKTKKYADHVIVVDDGSTDETAEIARDAGADVIIHPRNKGKGYALKTGFFAASQNGTKVIVTIDADGQHNPSDIPRVIKHIISGDADMVIGSRYLNDNIPIYRRIGQEILDRATNLNCVKNGEKRISDTQSGFRAFSVSTLSAFHFRHNGFR